MDLKRYTKKFTDYIGKALLIATLAMPQLNSGESKNTIEDEQVKAAQVDNDENGLEDRANSLGYSIGGSVIQAEEVDRKSTSVGTSGGLSTPFGQFSGEYSRSLGGKMFLSPIHDSNGLIPGLRVTSQDATFSTMAFSYSLGNTPDSWYRPRGDFLLDYVEFSFDINAGRDTAKTSGLAETDIGFSDQTLTTLGVELDMVLKRLYPELYLHFEGSKSELTKNDMFPFARLLETSELTDITGMVRFPIGESGISVGPIVGSITEQGSKSYPTADRIFEPFRLRGYDESAKMFGVGGSIAAGEFGYDQHKRLLQGSFSLMFYNGDTLLELGSASLGPNKVRLGIEIGSGEYDFKLSLTNQHSRASLVSSQFTSIYFPGFEPPAPFRTIFHEQIYESGDTRIVFTAGERFPIELLRNTQLSLALQRSESSYRFYEALLSEPIGEVKNSHWILYKTNNFSLELAKRFNLGKKTEATVRLYGGVGKAEGFVKHRDEFENFVADVKEGTYHAGFEVVFRR
tara:strand:+ start:2884 stop:4425 length:1542 start_codon:yes stop_codon:yes gene_type:complete